MMHGPKKPIKLELNMPLYLWTKLWWFLWYGSGIKNMMPI